MSALRKELGIDEIHDQLAELKLIVKGLAIDRRPEWYTLQQVADERECSLRAIQRHIAEGKLKAVTRGGKRWVHRDDV